MTFSPEWTKAFTALEKEWCEGKVWAEVCRLQAVGVTNLRAVLTTDLETLEKFHSAKTANSHEFVVHRWDVVKHRYIPYLLGFDYEVLC